MKSIKQVLDSLGRSPIKSTLTILTVGLGVGVLILVLSMTTAIEKHMDQQLTDEGYVLMVANAEPNEDDQPEALRPPEFDAGIVETLKTMVPGVVAVSPIQNANWQDFLSNNRQYRIRSSIAVSEEYAEVMELELIAGSYFTKNDVDSGMKYAILTESLAITLFGSPAEALGETLSVPMVSGGGGMVGRRNFTPPSFEVYGVVEDPSELVRKAYGIGDFIAPFTAALPSGANVQRMLDFFYGTVAVRIQGVEIKTATAQIRQAVATTYGEDTAVMVWEGTAQGESTYLSDVRSSISTFSLVGNILGFVLLAVASIGIMSIMLVEAIGRSKDIALERALGASGRRIIGEYFSRSVIISVISGIVGVVFSIILSGPLAGLVAPVFEGFSGIAANGNVVTVQATAIAVGVAAMLGGVFGTFPVYAVLRTRITEGLRDV